MSEEQAGPKWLKLVAMFKEFATPKYGWLAFGLVVVLLTAAFGGMEEVPADPVSAKKAGESVNAHPFDFTLESARVTNTQPGYSHPSKDQRFLVVTGTMVSKFEAPVGSLVLSEALRFEEDRLLLGTSEMAWQRVRPNCQREGFPIGDAQPNVAFEFTCYVSQKPAQEAPRELKVHLRKQTYRTDSLAGGMRWFDPSDVAVVSLEVR